MSLLNVRAAQLQRTLVGSYFKSKNNKIKRKSFGGKIATPQKKIWQEASNHPNLRPEQSQIPRDFQNILRVATLQTPGRGSSEEKVCVPRGGIVELTVPPPPNSAPSLNMRISSGAGLASAVLS